MLAHRILAEIVLRDPNLSAVGSGSDLSAGLV
jgi:hypothetical protein